MNQLPPNVSLDSARIRRIREDSKLTQLYVAKVVGVTPDTISRWENNRYPTIKRENALRLAEALEVEVTAILKGEEEAAAPVGEGLSAPLPGRKGVFWPVLLLFAGGMCFWLFFRQPAVPPPQLVAQRWLPHFAAPGSALPVRICFELEGDPGGFILREQFPVGWTLIEASPPPASLDKERGIARWIVKPGEVLTTISYRLRVAVTGVSGEHSIFSGTVVVSPEDRSRSLSVQGATQLELAPYHWADSNGDQRVDDAEMLSASEDFDAMPGLRLDWNRLEKIWDAGGYRWDQETEQFVPEKELPVATPSTEESTGR
ncbi:MAG: helix-turn-helix transcriptional regulator [Desulfuromonadaceae bacterium]